jgi:hypothetical protein
MHTAQCYLTAQASVQRIHSCCIGTVSAVRLAVCAYNAQKESGCPVALPVPRDDKRKTPAGAKLT